MQRLVTAICLLLVVQCCLCQFPLKAAYFRPTDGLDFGSLPNTGYQIFVIGGWFKWSNCDKQHLASACCADKGDLGGSGTWPIWHQVSLIPISSADQRRHDCGKWVAAAWIFDISSGSLAINPVKGYMMPHVDPAGSLSSTSKEIIYTVG